MHRLSSDEANKKLKIRKYMENSVNILGIRFDNPTLTSLARTLEDLMKNGTHAKIFTPNPDMIMGALRSSRLSEMINSAELVIADGSGVVLASKILGTPLHARFPGIDIAEYLLSRAAQTQSKVFFLGAAPKVAEIAARNMRSKYPGLCICGTHDGYFEPSGKEERRLIENLRELAPDILFVCMGFPRQEEWICRNAHKIPSLKLSMGLGGSFDVWSGQKKRAPVFFRKIGAEWLWRILKEPRRAKFLLKMPAFLIMILRQKLSGRYKKAMQNGKFAH